MHTVHFISIHRKDDFSLNQIFFRIISSYSVNWVATRKNINWIERKKERKFLFWVFFDWLYINWLVVAQCTIIITHPSINPWFVCWLGFSAFDFDYDDEEAIENVQAHHQHSFVCHCRLMQSTNRIVTFFFFLYQ